MSKEPGTLKKAVIIEGRYNRSEYLVSMLIFAACVGVAESIPVTGGLLVLTYCIAGSLAWIAIVRRLHDLGWSGWWSLASLVPVANFAVGILVAFMPGQNSRNKYDDMEAALYEESDAMFLSRDEIFELARNTEESEIKRAIEDFRNEAERNEEESSEALKPEKPEKENGDLRQVTPIGRLVMTVPGMYCVDDGLFDHKHGKGRGATRVRI